MSKLTMFINKLNDTDKYLQYLIEDNPNLILIKNHKIILRADHKSMHEVKVLSCGPSGRAPLPTGMVGPGMLTGAVVGDSHNTPSLLSVLTALRETGRDHSAGVLVIAMNSPAERLVSRMACQRAVDEGIKTRCIMVGEDTSGVEVNRADGRRGHCGVMFLQKLAGAMAQEKKTLEEIYMALVKVKHRSLGSVSWWERDGKVVVGPGLVAADRARGVDLYVDSMSEIVLESLEFLFNPSFKHSLDIARGDEIAVIINNMGSLTEFQFRLVVGEIKQLIQELGLDIVRCYDGRFLATEVGGVSLSVLKLDKHILKLLDSPTTVKIWPQSVPETRKNLLSLKERIVEVETEIGIYDINNIGPMFSYEDAKLAVNIICNIIVTLEEEDVFLDELDEDHDYGSTLKTFLVAVKTAMEEKTLAIVSPYGLLNDLAELAATTGGMVGPVISLLMSGASQAFLPYLSHLNVSWSMWLEAAGAARTALCAFTEAALGDGTILDALHPFVEAFHTPNAECLAQAVEAAGRGASQVPADPGAMSLYAALSVILQTLTQTNTKVTLQALTQTNTGS